MAARVSASWVYVSKRDCCDGALQIAQEYSAQACYGAGGVPRPTTGTRRGVCQWDRQQNPWVARSSAARPKQRCGAGRTVRQTRLIEAVVLGLLAVACAARQPTAPAPVATAPADLSGFLDDYSRLRPGGPGEVRFVYRDPAARWDAYDKVSSSR
jgi:hypothetical protein